jgi:hypothetical protein
MKKTLMFVLSSALCAGFVVAQTPSSSSTTTKATTSKTTTAKTATASTPAATAASKPATTPKAAASGPPPSASDIASAKAKGLVWVNLNTKVYHGAGDKEYGTTKNGKFMTEADAKAAGARIAKR